MPSFPPGVSVPGQLLAQVLEPGPLRMHASGRRKLAPSFGCVTHCPPSTHSIAPLPRNGRSSALYGTLCHRFALSTNGRIGFFHGRAPPRTPTRGPRGRTCATVGKPERAQRAEPHVVGRAAPEGAKKGSRKAPFAAANCTADPVPGSGGARLQPLARVRQAASPPACSPRAPRYGPTR